MFNVGDIVEITEQSSATGMLDCVKGKGYEVMATDAIHWHSQLVQLKDESGAEGWFHYNHFKLKESYESVKKKECLFKEGQVVWDVVYGKGVVVEIVEYSTFPVIARFSNETMSYTADGRTYETHGRTLFFSEPKIEAATKPLFEPVLKNGDVVIAVAIDNNDQHTALALTSLAITVTGEDEYFVKTRELGFMGKQWWDFYRLGEKINFK